MKYVGTPVEGLKSRRLVAGRGQYVGDLRMDGMLHVAIVRSPYAHARIRRIDAGEAAAVPGVAAVVTGDEIKQHTNLLSMPLDPAAIGLQAVKVYALSVDRVRYVGEPVAAVVAEDKYTARRAADLIEVDYEELPVVVDCEAALKPDSPLVEPAWGTNAMASQEFRAGDVDRAFAEADGTVSGVVKTQRYTGTPIEPRGHLATYDSFRELLTLWASTQQPHVLKTILAETLGIPETGVRVIQADVGGAFGLKMPTSQEDILIPYLARKLGRPVRWIEERSESFLVGGHARENRIHFEAAYRKDGTVIGLRARVISDIGAPSGLQGWGMAMVTAACIPTVYKIPHCHIQVQAVVTNKCSWSAYRGFGKEAASFLMDRVMDRVAEAAGVDRSEVRFKNFIQPEEFPFHQVSGVILDSGNYPGAMRKLLEAIDYRNFPTLQAEARRQGRHIGIGIGHELMPEGGAAPNALISSWDGATVRVSPSGDVKVLTGVTSPGTGNETGIAQIVADAMGADLERVSVVQGDTDSCPFGLGNYSSRSILIGGVAASQAAVEIRGKMFKVASSMLEVLAPDLDAESSRIFVKDTPAHSVTFKEVASAVYRDSYGQHALDLEPGLETTRYFRHANVYTRPEMHPFGGINTYPSWPSGMAACIVEVDPETGLIKVLRYCFVHDSGRIVNPMLAEGNMHGGFAQGLGGALYECLAYNEAGQLMTTTFYDYTIPTAADLPTFEIQHQETLSPFNPLGCKGVGESGCGAPLGAICSAVENAIPGLRISEMPLTPGNVWNAIRNARPA